MDTIEDRFLDLMNQVQSLPVGSKKQLAVIKAIKAINKRKEILNAATTTDPGGTD